VLCSTAAWTVLTGPVYLGHGCLGRAEQTPRQALLLRAQTAVLHHVPRKRAGAGFGTLDRRNRSMRPCSGPPPSRHAAPAGWLAGCLPGCRPSLAATPHHTSLRLASLCTRPTHFSSRRPVPEHHTWELCCRLVCLFPALSSCVRDDQSFHHRTLTPVHARSLESAAL
jgi:hypothetical protein